MHRHLATFAFGAAGTLWALSRTGHEVPADHVRWLVDRVKAGESGDGPGFTGGLAGLGHTLDALGGTDSFATGRSGLALAALFHHQVTDDARWLDVAVDLAARMEQGPGHARRVGLLHGRTGPPCFTYTSTVSQETRPRGLGSRRAGP
ncbi:MULTISPECIES: hypothetical protein [unclassified Streptomyces]|uniref:hypothetical protein n=1 Tax=unclassified Streptomyces TaxID=2593676 RepID=UPI002366E8C6|nr:MULTISPECIES: hypothetical protein [unclassified Streptomyces]MDF3140724.1 hypothetical protein [Streptomyces sp. T21Q-yed]WDF41023.1 hypothetical protein PBV52_31700 [Streptomyces sp. T12]